MVAARRLLRGPPPPLLCRPLPASDRASVPGARRALKELGCRRRCGRAQRAATAPDPGELLLGESQEAAEQQLQQAWAAFCHQSGGAAELFASAVERMLAKRASDRVDTARRWDRNLQLHAAEPLWRYM